MTTSTGKDAEAFRTISEVAEALNLPQHVLRFWETRFTQIKPMKRAGGRRFYRPQDIELLGAIRQLLYGHGYTIKGVQRILREQGPRAVTALASRSDGPLGAVAAAELEQAMLPVAMDGALADAELHALETSVLLQTALRELQACREALRA